MSVALIDLTFALVMATTGLLAGWWLKTASARSRSTNVLEESRHAREVLGRLQQLAMRMAENVGEHSSRVEEINQELSSTDAHEPEAVVAAVAKLIQANQQMQHQLSTAEEKFQEQARLVETHAAAARTDALTGLANRRALDDDLSHRFAESRRTGRPLSVIIGDIDHFKQFNDAHGHQTGDEVLRGVARVLRRTVRDMDLVARYGGEEFAVILPETLVGDAVKSLERMRQAIEVARFRVSQVELRVTMSFGVAQLIDGEEAAALVRRADAALYASKDAGRNCGHWHDGQQIHAVAPSEPAAKPPQPQKPPAAEPATHQSGKPAAQSAPAPAAERLSAKTKPEAAHPANPATTESPPGEAANGAHRDRPKPMVNRSEFCLHVGRRLAEWRRGGAAPAVLLVRVDDYPNIVARHGRPAATVVLRATAQFLGAAVREMDVASEYEEATFAMLLPGAPLASMIGVAERLRQAIARCSLPMPTGPIHFTVSVAGAATVKSDESQTLLWRTEEALDAATKAGGNASFFHNGQWSETVTAALERARATAN
jgi:diguanylate cyclase